MPTTEHPELTTTQIFWNRVGEWMHVGHLSMEKAIEHALRDAIGDVRRDISAKIMDRVCDYDQCNINTCQDCIKYRQAKSDAKIAIGDEHP